MTQELVKVMELGPIMQTPDEATASLVQMQAVTQARRVVTLEYVKHNFTENVDFGPSDPRSDKKTLLKPGAEKLCRLFNTQPRWTMDKDTWLMTGSKPGVVCYLCEIVDRATGKVLGEGRGAGEVGQQGRDVNKAVKIAEKRAEVDAALNVFCLSELFTQDLEDSLRTAAGESDADHDTPATPKDKHNLFLQVQTYIREHLPKGATALVPAKLIQAANAAELGKGVIETMKELERVREAIMAGKYDLETGSRIPEQLGGNDNPSDYDQTPQGEPGENSIAD